MNTLLFTSPRNEVYQMSMRSTGSRLSGSILSLAAALWAGPAPAYTFDQLWHGRIARPPGEGTASVYWEDVWDARGQRFRPDKVSCAHRFEPFGTVFVVTNLENGRTIDCPVQDRGPFIAGRVLDFSRGAARAIGCDGLCRVEIRRKGFE